MGTANTSARISLILDSRSSFSAGYWSGAYAFTYNSDAIPHLVSIGSASPYSNGFDGERWSFTYSTLASLTSPISGAQYGATAVLAGLQQTPVSGGANAPPAAAFSYSSAAEMTQYTTPLGGSISWGYRNFTYAGGIALREINSRSMNQGAGGFANSQGIWHDDATDAGLTYHYVSALWDNGAGTQKNYYSYPASAGSSLIVPTYYQELRYVAPAVYTLQKTFAWGQTSGGNSYMLAVTNILDPGASSQIYSASYQTLDNYGNLIQQQVYDYGASTPSRTYNLTYVTDSNYTSRYIRNRLLYATVTANGVVTTLVSNVYDAQGPPQPLGPLQDPSPGVAILSHDASYDVNFIYRGNVTLKASYSGTTSYAYQITGIPYKMQDGDGLAITTAPSSATAYSLPSALTPNGNANLATSFTYTPAFAVTSVTGANGATTGQISDPYGRPASFSTADGGGATYSYTYAPNTQTATFTTTANCPPATGCASGSTTKTTGVQWRRLTFDGFGRTIKTETGHDNNVLVNTVDTVYGACGCSPLGKVVQVSMPYGPGETEVWTTYMYDASGRQLSATVPDGSVTATSYSGNTVTTKDPAGIWKKNFTDAFGNLVAVYEPDPTTGSDTGGPVTNYTYNGANQVVAVAMTRGGITQNRSFTWSGTDLVSETTPEAGTVTYQYDGNHHVTQRIDAMNQKTTYTYDGYERLTATQHYVWGPNPNCTLPCQNTQWNAQPLQDVSYYYDTPFFTDYTQNNTWGRLAGVVFHSQGTSSAQIDFHYGYSYNQGGRVTGNRMLVQGNLYNPVDLKGQYTWDNQGRLTGTTYPSGLALSTQFDVMGRPNTLTCTTGGANCAGGQTIGTATYGSASQLLTMNGETRTYNNLLQLTHLTNAGVDMQYIYPVGHNNGRVTQTIDAILGETVNYTYDYLHRLTGAAATNGSWGEAYAFDGFGNLTGKTPTQGVAPVMTGVVNPPENATGGNLPGFDIEQRPMTTGTSFYVYDPWGRRIWKQMYNTNTTVTTYEAYFHGVTGQKLDTYTANPTTGWAAAGVNVYFAGEMVMEKGVYVSTDRLGSVRHNSNGESFSYFPWGEERGAGTADGRTKFAGYFRDQPGQDYANARYYNAGTGSFWSPDPGGIKTADSGNPGTWNRYAYVAGDPVNFKDPRGTDMMLAIGSDPDFGYGDLDCMLDGVPISCSQIHGSSVYVASPAPAFASADASCEGQVIAGAILTDAANIGLNFQGYDTQNVGLSIAGVGGSDMTELTLQIATGQDPSQAFANLLQPLGSDCYPKITAACSFQPSGSDPLHGVFTYSYRQVTSDGTNSMQISYSPTSPSFGLQIDIDPHNPQQNLFGHALDVITDFMLATDTSYFTVARQLGISVPTCH